MMSDNPRNQAAGEDPQSVAVRNRETVRREARCSERKGIEELERGALPAAIDALREAVDTYESLGDTVHRDSAEQYMALAMYEQGDVDDAVGVWEDLVARGWDRPTTLNFLVRHYERIGDEATIERLYACLAKSKREGSGFFSEFAGGDELRGAAAAGEGRHRLLVADNDPAVRGVLGRILQGQGYAVLYAEDGEGALAAVFDAAPDLVFLDVYMPRLSGLDVLYRMRAEGVGTPVVVISGRSEASMVQDARALGARFAGKPLDFEQISDLVREVLTGNRG